MRLLRYSALLLVCAVAAAESPLILPAGKGKRPFDVTHHSVPINEILGGGPPRDGIPALDAPKFVSADTARKFLSDKDRVLGVAVAGGAKAYPIRILNWHEIVNDEIHGRPIAVTWCPLCVSGIVYDPVLKGKRLTFGVTGKLYKTSLVMYDRQTESLWSQILQAAITGPMTGTKLSMLPAQHTTWAEWRRQHPDTLVLSPDTGYDRDYGLNPYAEYYEQGIPFGGPRAWAHPLDPDTRPMERVLGIQLGEVKKAYSFSRLKKQGASFEDEVAGRKVVIHFDRRSDSAYASTASGEPVPSLVTFWFAWVDFYPDTRVFEGSSKPPA